MTNAKLPKQKPVFILCAADDEALPLLSVTLFSLGEHADPARDYVVTILTEGQLMGETALRETVRPFSNLSLSFLDVSETFRELTLYTENRPDLSRAAYYRLAAADLFPGQARALYLDCDLVILHDVGELFDADLGDALLGGVRDYTGIGIYYSGEDDRKEYYDSLAYPCIEDYVNSGVLLMDLSALRKEGLTGTFLAMAAKGEYHFHDQDILNLACKGRIHILDAAWNVSVSACHIYERHLPKPLLLEERAAQEMPFLVHFSGYDFKPYVRLDGPAEEYFWPRALRIPAPFQKTLFQKARKMQPYRAYLLRCTPRRHLAFELDVTSHCNLNCRSCSHFSPVAGKSFLSLTEAERDFSRLSRLFLGTVDFIHLMGGEPLLHPQIAELAAMARSFFPRGRIEIVTNGLLLMQQPEHFWTACRENSIQISVTKYPLDSPYEEMRALAWLCGVKLIFYNRTAEEGVHFRKLSLDSKGEQDPDLSFPNCYLANECITLRQGRLYPCSLAGCAYRLIEAFPGYLSLSEEDGVDIYAAKNGGEILRRLCRPIPFCAYCKSTEWHKQEFPWTKSKGEPEEWIDL